MYGLRVFYLGKDTWKEAPRNAPLIRLLLSDRVDGRLRWNGLFVSSGYMGVWEHVSFGAVMMGHIHNNLLSGCAPFWEAFLGGLSLGTPRVLDSYK